MTDTTCRVLPSLPVFPGGEGLTLPDRLIINGLGPSPIFGTGPTTNSSPPSSPSISNARLKNEPAYSFELLRTNV
jgi:hypothetical protein